MYLCLILLVFFLFLAQPLSIYIDLRFENPNNKNLRDAQASKND